MQWQCEKNTAVSHLGLLVSSSTAAVRPAIAVFFTPLSPSKAQKAMEQSYRGLVALQCSSLLASVPHLTLSFREDKQNRDL